MWNWARKRLEFKICIIVCCGNTSSAAQCAELWLVAAMSITVRWNSVVIAPIIALTDVAAA